jgi:ADYC domain/Pentapeptide repeats (8 copies)
MFDRARTSLAWLATAALVTGCTQAVPGDDDDDESVSVASQAYTHANDGHLNGVHLNGNEFNGVHLNGVHLNGVHLNNVALNGVHLNGTELRGTPEGSVEIGDDDLLGVKMTAELSNEDEIELVINDIDVMSGRYYYTVSYTTDGGSSWNLLCGEESSTPIQALLLANRWDNVTGDRITDSTMVTVACQGSALAKCAEWGYAPWASDIVESDEGNVNQHNIARAELHQACTRMVRGDYCGDGTAHTVAGTMINIWDNFKIQERDTGSTMPLEAEWSPDGAVCVKHTRWRQSSTNPDYDYIMTNCSSRWAGPSSSTCGNDTYSTFVTENGYSTSLSSRALVRNESDDDNIY